LIYLIQTKQPVAWGRGIGMTFGFLLLLITMMFALGFAAYKFRPEIVLPILEGQQRDAGTFIADSFSRRLSYIGSLLTLLAYWSNIIFCLLTVNRPLKMNLLHHTFCLMHLFFYSSLLGLS
jgi:hypothetical protein